MSQISGWGGRAVRAYEIVGEDLEHLTRDVPLSRGLGRSYGDSSLPPSSHPVVVGTTLSDRVLGFDNDTGVLRAEAGLSLKRLYQVLLPRGWFTPVSPGTWNVTLGGWSPQMFTARTTTAMGRSGIMFAYSACGWRAA